MNFRAIARWLRAEFPRERGCYSSEVLPNKTATIIVQPMTTLGFNGVPKRKGTVDGPYGNVSLADMKSK